MDMGKRFNPWHVLRDLGEEWRLLWHGSLPNDVYGYTHYPSRTIVMRKGMSFEERRCTIAHEVTHVSRGPSSKCSSVAEEYAVDLLVSRALVPCVRDLADALLFHHGSYDDAASELWVDAWTLETRLGALRPDEVTYLRGRLGEVLLEGA